MFRTNQSSTFCAVHLICAAHPEDLPFLSLFTLFFSLDIFSYRFSYLGIIKLDEVFLTMAEREMFLENTFQHYNQIQFNTIANCVFILNKKINF